VGWVEDLSGHVVALNTAPLIYYIEANPAYLPRVDPFFEALGRDEIHAITSIVTLAETLVQPIRKGDVVLMSRYEDLLLDTAQIDTIDLNAPIAQEVARLRASYGLPTPDAIQLTTALVTGASAFLTNDVRLVVVPDIKVIVLDRLPPT